MNNKIKDKIEKLLNLSMSDNEHESSLALQKALKLMNDHNITKDDVYRQNFINKEMTFKKIYRVPNWQIELHSNLSSVSGCYFTWKDGSKHFETEAKGTITGRERDVENAVYLIEFLKKEVEIKTNERKKLLKASHVSGTSLSNYLKNFKTGLIRMVCFKLEEQQEQFFTQQEESGLVCIDTKSKIKDSVNFFGKDVLTHKSKAKEDEHGLRDGMLSGKEIELNQAVSKQKKTLQIGV